LLDSESTRLPPNQTLQTDLKVFFGANGWTFNKPGLYRVRATFPDHEMKIAAQAEAEVQVDPPDPNLAGAQNLIHGKEQALFLLLDGGDHLISGKQALQQLTRRFPNSPQAAAARVSLGLAALEPTINPRTGIRPAARIELAKTYLLDSSNLHVPDRILNAAQATLGTTLLSRGDLAGAEQVRQDIIRRNTENPEVIQLMRRMEGLQELLNTTRERYPS
jgi:hypothetical protein